MYQLVPSVGSALHVALGVVEGLDGYEMLGLAKAMPEDKYSCKTTPSQRDFAQQVLSQMGT